MKSKNNSTMKNSFGDFKLNNHQSFKFKNHLSIEWISFFYGFFFFLPTFIGPPKCLTLLYWNENISGSISHRNLEKTPSDFFLNSEQESSLICFPLQLFPDSNQNWKPHKRGCFGLIRSSINPSWIDLVKALFS